MNPKIFLAIGAGILGYLFLTASKKSDNTDNDETKITVAPIRPPAKETVSSETEQSTNDDSSGSGIVADSPTVDETQDDTSGAD